MGATLAAIGTLFYPAAFSLIVFLLITHVFIPAWRENRDNQNHYLLDQTSMGAPYRRSTASGQLFTATGRLFAAIGSLFSALGDLSVRVLAAQRQRLFGSRDGPALHGDSAGLRSSSHAEDAWLSDGEDAAEHQNGEELGPVRHELPRGGAAYDTGRLSRDLEQGFMDDSDGDDDPRR